MSSRVLRRCWLVEKQQRALRMISTSKHRNKDEKSEKDLKIANPMGVRSVDELKESIKPEDPFKRTAKILKNDLKDVGRKLKKFAGFQSEFQHDENSQFFPTHTDVLIIGGGAIGSSISYFLKQRAPHATSVTVIEKDPSYAEASTCLSAGGLRQQFSLPENIKLSLFGAEFLKNIGKHLHVDGHPTPDVQFQPNGYLVLASEEGASTLKQNVELQRNLGARNALLTPAKIKEKFPWIDTKGVELGCLGLEMEGWFDPWSLLISLKKKSINLGTEFVQGELVGFEFMEQPLITAPSATGKYEELNRAIIQLPDGSYQTIKFGFCIIAAGAKSGEVAKLAKIGEGDGLLGVPLPIEPRKRYVYFFHCPGGPGLDTPLLIDSTGAYFRREGFESTYIGGMSPSPEDEPPVDDLSVDYNFFEEKVWPTLAKRVPVFENLKVKSAWAGYYEYNTMDENGVVGPHPYYHNLFIASGFSGHGIQHAPGIGRAVMELLIDGEYKTIDLSRFGYERLCLGEPLRENNIY